MSFNRAGIVLLAVTSSFICAIAYKSVVMTFDHAVYVWHTAVRYLQSIPVEYLSEAVVGWEVFIYQDEEFPGDIRFYALAVWWVEPNKLSFPPPAASGFIAVFVNQRRIKPASFECFLIWRFSFIKDRFVRRNAL